MSTTNEQTKRGYRKTPTVIKKFFTKENKIEIEKLTKLIIKKQKKNLKEEQKLQEKKEKKEKRQEKNELKEGKLKKMKMIVKSLTKEEKENLLLQNYSGIFSMIEIKKNIDLAMKEIFDNTTNEDYLKMLKKGLKIETDRGQRISELIKRFNK
tara:strand:- start:4455 stop:4913 length:459 start_codon:yes stop_codon:yes gene_type:complete